MPRRDDDTFDIPSIVPDAEGRPSKQVAQEPSVSNVPSEHRTTVKVALPLLFLALAGACAFFHYELTKLRTENQQWSARVANLESQLGVAHSENQATRQTLDQKVATLETNVKARQDDIKKIQQAAQVAAEAHSKELAALKTQATQLQQQDKQQQQQSEQLKKDNDARAQQLSAQLSQLETTQAGVAKTISEQLSPLADQVQQLQASVEQSRTQLSQASSQASEAAMSSAQAVEANEQLQIKLNELSKELRAQRESITSLDSFRRSANSDLNRLKQGSGAY